MYLLKTIIFIGLAVHLIHCGGQNNNESTVKVAKVENGVAKAEDGRVILSSQSEEGLVIPEGVLEGLRIDRALLVNLIISKVKSVSEVYDLSMKSKLTIGDFDLIGKLLGSAGHGPEGHPFITSFSVTTNSGVVYSEIECRTQVIDTMDTLYLKSCANDQVKISFEGFHFYFIPLREIVVDKVELSARLSKIDIKRELR